jgi:hypothetical protein
MLPDGTDEPVVAVATAIWTDAADPATRAAGTVTATEEPSLLVTTFEVITAEL